MRHRLIDLVASLKPGETVEIDEREFALGGQQLREYEHNGAVFTVPDVILENISGSAWEWWYYRVPGSRSVRFCRLERPSEIAVYVSPDRRS